MTVACRSIRPTPYTAAEDRTGIDRGRLLRLLIPVLASDFDLHSTRSKETSDQMKRTDELEEKREIGKPDLTKVDCFSRYYYCQRQKFINYVVYDSG